MTQGAPSSMKLGGDPREPNALYWADSPLGSDKGGGRSLTFGSAVKDPSF